MLPLKHNAYKSYSLSKMQGSDYDLVKTFLDTVRADMERKEFFYPYTDGELRSVIEGGCFWGLFDRGRLIATFSVDLDKEYARKLANQINSFSDIGIEYAYECSGLMVDRAYRGQGIAKYMVGVACAEAERRGIAICSVVHTQNVASMSTFFSLGFEMRATWRMDEDYTFIYLLKQDFQKVLQSQENYGKIDTVIGLPNANTQAHNELLSQGYAGVGCQDTTIFFTKKEKNL